VGDAAGFIDPLYSPGLDWMSYTVSLAVTLIGNHFSGKKVDLAGKVEMLNQQFARSYERWFEALYKDKYFYLGEFDLMKVAFLLDGTMYFMGVASQPFKRGWPAFLEPVFTTPPSVPFYHFMRFYNKRLAAIAKRRDEKGLLGRRNSHERFLFTGLSFSPFAARWTLRGLLCWLVLEMKEGWRTWFRSEIQGKTSVSMASPAQAKASVPVS
jgi:hypothetical protein